MTLFTDLIANPNARRIYLVEITGYDPVDAQEETYRYSSEGFITAATDTPAKEVYDPRLKRSMTYNRSMLRTGGQVVGASKPDFGHIVLNNNDGGLDFLEDFGFDGRQVVVKLGGEGFDLSDFGTVFDGVIKSVEFTFQDMTVYVADKKFEFEKTPISTTFYDGDNTKGDGTNDISFSGSVISSTTTDLSVFANNDPIKILGSTSNDGAYTVSGTPTATSLTVTGSFTTETAGAYEVAIRKTDDVGGDVNIKSKAKPMVFGEVKNIRPVLINEGGLIYEVHGYGPIHAIDAVYDKGVLLTLTTDYTVDLTNGRFTLTASPAGEVTCDVRGHKEGGTYLETTCSIVDRMIREFTTLQTADINASSLIALSALTPATVGIYVNPADVVEQSQERLDTVKATIDALMTGISGYHGFGRDGKFAVGRLEAPAVSADAEFTSIDILKIERLPSDIPPYRIRCKYARNWTVQNEGSLAAAVTDNRRNYLAKDSLVGEYEDTSVQTKHLLAEDWEPIESYYADEADAITEATRVQGLYGPGRDWYRVRVKQQVMDLDINATIKITYDRFGLDSGQNFRVIEFDENSAANTVEMLVWG